MPEAGSGYVIGRQQKRCPATPTRKTQQWQAQRTQLIRVPLASTYRCVAYVLPDLMPPGDQRGRGCRGRRRNHSFQLGLNFRPPGRAFAGIGRLVDRALVDQHGLVERESHGVLFLATPAWGNG